MVFSRGFHQGFLRYFSGEFSGNFTRDLFKFALGISLRIYPESYLGIILEIYSGIPTRISAGFFFQKVSHEFLQEFLRGFSDFPSRITARIPLEMYR